MIVIRALKKIKRFLKVFLLEANRRLLSVRYLYFKSKSPSEFSFHANLLVVKKSIYAPIAKVCVESFLFHNPMSFVTVHVDTATSAYVSRKLKKVVERGQAQIINIPNENQSWQDSKLDLIISLSDSRKFFMDADLKWNGPIPQLEGITLFVNEFKINENPFYSPLSSSPWFRSYDSATMKNTSFFYWGSYEPTLIDADFIRDIMHKVEEVTSNKDNDSNFNSSTKRISEQIALSLLVEKTGCSVHFLKSTDGFKDGSFVESSYFGATGTTF